MSQRFVKTAVTSAAINAACIWLAVLLTGSRPYTYFYPFVNNSCATQKRGVAWLPGKSVVDLPMVCARWYYHSASYRLPDGQALPIIATWDMMGRASGVLGADYDGYLIGPNEPDRPVPYGSQMTPQALADFVAELHTRYPTAVLVGPNTIDRAYIGDFLEVWSAKYGHIGPPYDVCGLHIYGDKRRLPSTRVTEMHRIFAAHGYPCADTWITEYGYPLYQVDTYDVWLEWTQDIEADGRISRYFGYTVDDGQFAASDYDMVKDGRLTESGRGFIDGARAVPPRSYP